MSHEVSQAEDAPPTWTEEDDGEVDRLIAAIDARLSAQVREVLRHPRFVALEAAWRELWFLIERVDFRENIRVELLDCAKDDLALDFEDSPGLTSSGLYKVVYDAGYTAPGGQPYGLLVGAYTFDAGPRDVALLQRIATVAATAHAPFVAAAAPSMFGVASWEELASHEHPEGPRSDAWQGLREREEARYVALTLPRFLLRAPHAAGAPGAAAFHFDDGGGLDPDACLWGNAAVALATRVADSFAKWRRGANIIRDDGVVEGLTTEPAELAEVLRAEARASRPRTPELPARWFVARLPVALVADFGLGDDAFVSATLDAAGVDALLRDRVARAVLPVLDARDPTLPPTLAELHFAHPADFTPERLVERVPSWRAALRGHARNGHEIEGLSDALRALLRDPSYARLERVWLVARWLARYVPTVLVHARDGAATPTSLAARAASVGVRDLVLDGAFHLDDDVETLLAWGCAAEAVDALVWFDPKWDPEEIVSVGPKWTDARSRPGRRALIPCAPRPRARFPYDRFSGGAANFDFDERVGNHDLLTRWGLAGAVAAARARVELDRDPLTSRRAISIEVPRREAVHGATGTAALYLAPFQREPSALLTSALSRVGGAVLLSARGNEVNYVHRPSPGQATPQSTATTSGAAEGLPLRPRKVARTYGGWLPVDCALSAPQEIALAAAGFTVLRFDAASSRTAFRAADSLRAPTSLGTSPEARAAEFIDRCGSQLPYLFEVCRLAHYLKVVARDDLHQLQNRQEIQEALNRWIGMYVCDFDDPAPGVRRYRSLRRARVVVQDVDARAGWRRLSVSIRTLIPVRDQDRRSAPDKYICLTLVGRLDHPTPSAPSLDAAVALPSEMPAREALAARAACPPAEAVAPAPTEAPDHPDASGLPRWLRDRVDAAVPDDVRHIGCVCVDAHRRFSLVPCSDGATFPAVDRRPGERPSEALTRCLQEHIGAAVATVYPLPGGWRHGGGPAAYFAAMLARSDAPPRSAPFGAEDAFARLAASPDLAVRERDLRLLALTRATSLSPARRLLLMVRELHAMGFEGIRPSCGRSVSGAVWRMDLTGPDAPADAPRVAFAQREVRLATSYATTEGQRVFGREDTCFESPLELAQRLLRGAPGSVHQGLARDPEYARWYADMLAVSGPDGLFIDHADYDLDGGAFYLVNVAEGTPVVHPPPPRPGLEVDVQVTLTSREDGLWFGRLDAPELLRARRWSVRVKAHGEPPAAFVELPRLAKVASWSDIADAVQRAEAQPFRTREVGPREGWFDIDHPTRWPAVLADKTVAIYLPPPWDPGRVTVELCARCARNTQ